jgi:hypothetical protein
MPSTKQYKLGIIVRARWALCFGGLTGGIKMCIVMHEMMLPFVRRSFT